MQSHNIGVLNCWGIKLTFENIPSNKKKRWLK